MLRGGTQLLIECSWFVEKKKKFVIKKKKRHNEGEPIPLHSVYWAFCTFSYPASSLQDALLTAGFHASRKRCRPQGVDGRRPLTVRRTEGVNLYTPPLLILPSLGRSWPYMLAAFCSCCRFERRLTNPPGAGDANLRRLGFFFFFLFSFLVAASSWALNAAKARPCSYYPHQKWRLGLLSHSWHPSSMSVPSDSVKPWHELFCIVTVNPSPNPSP